MKGEDLKDSKVHQFSGATIQSLPDGSISVQFDSPRDVTEINLANGKSTDAKVSLYNKDGKVVNEVPSSESCTTHESYVINFLLSSGHKKSFTKF